MVKRIKEFLRTLNRQSANITEIEDSGAEVFHSIDNGGNQNSDDSIKKDSANSLVSEVLSLKIFTEKKKPAGQDSDPFLDITHDKGIIAVFDGAGGASLNYKMDTGEILSGARMASDTARLCTQKVWRRLDIGQMNSFVKLLEKELFNQFKALKHQYGDQNANIKGTIKKNFPTTMAAIVYKIPAMKLSIEMKSVWAGDSRNFILHPTAGLIQISNDDLLHPADPMENKILESKMSNFINADDEFYLNEQIKKNFDLPIILISATDGCFHYLESPIHFENLLLKTLFKAKSKNEWSNFLRIGIESSTKDDATLALVALGWPDFESVQKSFVDRLEFLEEKYLSKLTDMKNNISGMEINLSAMEKDYLGFLDWAWRDYKKAYLSKAQTKE